MELRLRAGRRDKAVPERLHRQERLEIKYPLQLKRNQRSMGRREE